MTQHAPQEPLTHEHGADPVADLAAAGVSIWLDDLSRDRLTTGGLAALARDRHVVGVTTNPTIFASAVSKGTAYDEQLASLAAAGTSLDDAVLTVTTDDVRDAADVLRPLYEASDTVDGRVSIEVDPRLANDTEATIAAARVLWSRVDRPNVFVKIPATPAGLPAIAQALSEGISVNVTLIFSLARYAEVLEAFLDGLERARSAGIDLAPIGSVASFFVSRVDTAVDAKLDAIGSPEAAELRGQAAIANARLAYGVYQDTVAGARWQALAAAGAHPQRPLWASTGVKDKAYRDTRYVEELVVAGVVNTMPESTLDAVAHHGVIRGDTVTGTQAAAAALLDRIEGLGISIDRVTAELEDEGVTKFEKSWQEFLSTVAGGLGEQAPTGGEAAE